MLLVRGARRLVSVDVGRGQLAASLRQDARVLSLEGQDARTLTHDLVGEPPDLVVADASFIGLAKVLPGALALAAPGADLVALFKPQFEAGPEAVGKGGLVNDEAAVARARAALQAALGEMGWDIRAWTESPIAGGDGNREYLLHARPVPR